MIKSGAADGAWVEPRIGDWCQEIDGEDDKVFQIKNEKHLAIIKDWDCADIILLHRPFEVRDEILFGCDDSPRTWENQILTKDQAIFWNEYSFEDEEFLIRHKNPAWRDHPNYKGE